MSEAVVSGAVPPPPRRSLAQRAPDLLIWGGVILLLLASVGERSEVIAVIDRVIEDALEAGLSVVAVDAGSGEVSSTPGISDLAADRCDYGAVVQRASELWKRWDDPAVKWGEMTRGQWDSMQRFLVEQKLMDQPIDSATLFTTELIETINALDIAPIVQRARAA